MGDIKKEPFISNADLLMIMSFICALLINCILFLVHFWNYRNTFDLICIFVSFTAMCGWFIFSSLWNIKRFLNRRF